MRGVLAREMAAEFLGTFVLLMFGLGSVAQMVLSEEELGSPLSIHLSWGLGVVLAVALVGRISGAHLNPAVTLALAAHRRFVWHKVIPYILAQVAGAFFAAELIYVVYYEAFFAYDAGIRSVVGPTATAGIFATFPGEHLSTFPGGFIDQFVGTAILMLCIFGIGDSRNSAWAKPVAPLLVGLAVLGIGMSMGLNSGYAINPARDFGPRLFTYFAGWGPAVFTVKNHWWWVPIVAPCLGAVFAGFVYRFFVPDGDLNVPVPAKESNHPEPSFHTGKSLHPSYVE